MEETYTTKAIILNRQPFREVDSRAVIYSWDKGKLELIARGTKRIFSKLAGHLEPISLSQIMVVRGKQFDYIGSAVNENCYFNIKNDLEKLQSAGQAIGLFNKLIKEDGGNDAELFFGLLKDFLNILNNDQCLMINVQLLYHFFALKLLVALGYGPELYNCLICKNKLKPEENYFGPAKGGIICANCSRNNRLDLTITEDCVKVLRLAVNKNLNKLIKLNIKNKTKKEICKIISSFLEYNI